MENELQNKMTRPISKDLYKILIENLQDCAVFLTDEKGVIESWNQPAETLFGYSKTEAVGQNISLLHHDSKHELEQARRLGNCKIEGLRQRKDGSSFWAQIAIKAISEENGVLHGFVHSIRDITDIKQTQDRQRDALQAAVEASEAKNIFLANVSHELRTPLAAVLGFAELLSYPNLSEQKRTHYLAAIKRNTELLSGIISDILDLSKLEAGKLQIETRDVNIADLLDDLSIMLSPQANGKKIALNFHINPEIPKIIRTDPIRLKQILLNIIGNALKFTEQGGVNVAVNLLDQQQCHPKLAFIVEDSGIGISDEQAKHLFEPFSQADGTMVRRFGGTGLGLALSEQIASLLGGSVELTSSIPGKGSVFTISIATVETKRESTSEHSDRMHASESADALFIRS